MTAVRGAQVVVTGASSGIGRATATALADAGADLVLTGRDGSRLRSLAAVTGGRVHVVDLADTAQLERLAAALAASAPDVVVHNAGIGLSGRAAEATSADVERVLAVNLRAPVALTSAVLPAMSRRRSGHLVFVASVAGVLGVADESVYAASKGALMAYAASLRSELAPSGIRVTLVVPGVVDTEFFARRGAPYRRRWPRPVAAQVAARAIVRGIQRDRAEVVVPRWLRAAVAVHGIGPQTYARFADRWG